MVCNGMTWCTVTSRHNTPFTFSRQHNSGPSGSIFPFCSTAVRNVLVLVASAIGRDVRYTMCASWFLRSDPSRQPHARGRARRVGWGGEVWKGDDDGGGGGGGRRS